MSPKFGPRPWTAAVLGWLKRSRLQRKLAEHTFPWTTADMGRVLVTGGNRGLGLETCRQLSQLGFEVLLAARDEQAGQAAARSLGSGKVRALQLDVSDARSVDRVARFLADQACSWMLGQQRGGVAPRHQPRHRPGHLEVNYYGVVRVTDALLTSLAPSANVVMVSSGMGELSGFGEALRARLTDPELGREGLDALAQECLSGVSEDSLSARGFRKTCTACRRPYSTPSRASSATSSQEHAPYQRRVPRLGTDADGRDQAPRSVEEGAKGIVWAATLGEDGPHGGFFRDGMPIVCDPAESVAPVRCKASDTSRRCSDSWCSCRLRRSYTDAEPYWVVRCMLGALGNVVRVWLATGHHGVIRVARDTASLGAGAADHHLGSRRSDHKARSEVVRVRDAGLASIVQRAGM